MDVLCCIDMLTQVTTMMAMANFMVVFMVQVPI